MYEHARVINIIYFPFFLPFVIAVPVFMIVYFDGSYVEALYPSSSDVVDLTETNFDKLVTQSDNIWIVEFFAPWCGHCQQFVPEFSKGASALKVRKIYQVY